MSLLPKDIIQRFEFDRIMNLAKEKCFGKEAKNYFDNFHFHTEAEELDKILEQVSQMKKSVTSTEPLIFTHYNSVADYFNNIHIEGIVLEIEAFLDLRNIAAFTNYLFNYFNRNHKEAYPALFEIVTQLNDLREVESIINRIIDEHGEIKTNASSQLLAISKQISSKQSEINRVFNSLATEFKNQGLLSETVETYRNGRRVLSLPVENKRKIRGIIHDESATGKTVYIEPEQIIELNNDLYDLELDYKNEIYVILKKATNDIRPFSNLSISNHDLISKLDIISSKAKVAISMNASKPNVSNIPGIKVMEAYHPILLLNNQETGKKTIPFDLELSDFNRIVVVSGPNAGGKSITLKTIALLQLMCQGGFLIPANENSTFGIFKKIFADIGDQQSLYDSLSTYSSRLRNMKNFLEQANPSTLILIDEFGTGTDPKIGGAIAEAVLNELNRMKVFGVITTHYTNLKLYAFKNKGILNASMQFDKENLLPTYKLIVGKPGSSYAFEMAQNSGLNKKILNYARFKAGKNIKKIEDVLVELQENKADYELKILDLKLKESKLDELIRKNEVLYNELVFNKKKLKLEKKQNVSAEINKFVHEFNKKLNSLQSNIKKEEIHKLANDLKEKKQEITNDIQILSHEIIHDDRSEQSSIEIGDYVQVNNGEMKGLVVKISKGKATLQTDHYQLEIPILNLKKTPKPLEIKTSGSIKTSLNSNVDNFETSIDIRGYTIKEAIETLHRFFDGAILNNSTYLTILHGKGNGSLRKLVAQIASEYKVIEELSHPPSEKGGDGITFVKLKT